jgi:phosphoglycolate phosphatase
MPRSFSQVRALVFDLDGTLIDSKLDLALSVNAALIELHRPPLPHEQIYGYVGQGALRLVEQALGDGADPKEVEHGHEFFLSYYRAHMLDQTIAYPGVREGLAALENWSLAVLTNKPTRFSQEILVGLDLAKYFRVIHGGNSFEKKKPDPVGMLAIAREFGLSPKQTMLVGDSDIDVQTARNAGSWVCGVTYGFGSAGLVKCPPDLLLDSLIELPAYLEGHALQPR